MKNESVSDDLADHLHGEQDREDSASEAKHLIPLLLLLLVRVVIACEEYRVQKDEEHNEAVEPSIKIVVSL
jgi:hypothetical protein